MYTANYGYPPNTNTNTNAIANNHNSILNKDDFKFDLGNYLKELNDLKNEKMFLKSELDLLQQEFFNENVCTNSLQLILRNYSTQISNLTSRFQNAENGFIKLARLIDMQTSNVCIDDSLVIKNLAQRLADTIQMYEDLNKKFKTNQFKLDAYERRESVSVPFQKSQKKRTNDESQKSTTTSANNNNNGTPSGYFASYIQTTSLVAKLNKFLKHNNITHSLFSHKILGMSEVKFRKLIAKPTQWLLCKPQKKHIYQRIKQFLNNKSGKIELLNYSLVASGSCNTLDGHNDDPYVYNDVNINTLALSAQLVDFLAQSGIDRTVFGQKYLNMADKKLFVDSIINNPPSKWTNATPAVKEAFLKIKFFLQNPSEYLYLFDSAYRENGTCMNGIANDNTMDSSSSSSSSSKCSTSSQQYNNDQQSDDVVLLLGEGNEGVMNKARTIQHDYQTSVDDDLLRLCATTRDFVDNNGINYKTFAQQVLGISRRSFSRLIQNQFNINTCKPSTKENLLKLKTFFNDPNAISHFLSRNNVKKEQNDLSSLSFSLPNTTVNNSNTTASFYTISESNTDIVITNELYSEISERTKAFMRDYKITNSQLGRVMFGITRRAFNRLLTNQAVTNWNNCKPLTKERLIRLKQMLDDDVQIKQVLDKIRNSQLASNSIQVHSDDGDLDDMMQTTTCTNDQTSGGILHDSNRSFNNFDDEGNVQARPLDETTCCVEPVKHSFSIDHTLMGDVIIEGWPIIDLNELVQRTYKFLQANAISQKTFSNAILGISKTHFNKLISKPAHWHTCKIQTKKIYIALNMFLNDETKINDFLGFVRYDQRKSLPSAIQLTTPTNPKTSNIKVQQNIIDIIESLKAFLIKNGISSMCFASKVLSINSEIKFNRILAYPSQWSINDYSEFINYANCINSFLKNAKIMNEFLLNYQQQQQHHQSNEHNYHHNHLNAHNLVKHHQDLSNLSNDNNDEEDDDDNDIEML